MKIDKQIRQWAQMVNENTDYSDDDYDPRDFGKPKYVGSDTFPSIDSFKSGDKLFTAVIKSTSSGNQYYSELFPAKDINDAKQIAYNVEFDHSEVVNVIEYNPKKLISDALQSYNMLRKTAGLMCGVFKTNIYEEISELKSKTHIKEFDEINDFVSYHDDILEKMAVQN